MSVSNSPAPLRSDDKPPRPSLLAHFAYEMIIALAVMVLIAVIVVIMRFDR